MTSIKVKDDEKRNEKAQNSTEELSPLRSQNINQSSNDDMDVERLESPALSRGPKRSSSNDAMCFVCRKRAKFDINTDSSTRADKKYLASLQSQRNDLEIEMFNINENALDKEKEMKTKVQKMEEELNLVKFERDQLVAELHEKLKVRCSLCGSDLDAEHHRPLIMPNSLTICEVCSNNPEKVKAASSSNIDTTDIITNPSNLVTNIALLHILRKQQQFD